MSITSSGNWNGLQALGFKELEIAFRFTTDGSNDPTLADTRDGLLSIARATNAYTVTLLGGKPFRTARAIIVGHSATSTVNCTPTFSATAGTVTLSFSGAMTSQTVDCIVRITDSSV